MEDSLGFFNLAGLLLLGGALLWAVRLVYGNRPRSSDDVVKRALTVAGWTAIWLGGGAGRLRHVGKDAITGEAYFLDALNRS